MHAGDVAGAAVTGGSGRGIRTPDQRLRIFVSSTLRELEPERRAARAAIEGLRLAPVMFELGARPHPPRDLYRAYLEQSEVFVGIYWQQYGWVAPGEDVSGIEDEYRLAPRAMPKLVYVKQPAERDERLDALMARIRDDDTISYTSFSTPAELAELVEADLAILLAERFSASREPETPNAADDGPTYSTGHLPGRYSDAVGREREIATLLGWLGDDGNRLITLVGPGGIGKTRLAIEVGHRAGARFDRVTFVPLEHVRDPGDVLKTIARELGVHDSGDRPIAHQLGVARAGRRDLLLLDNFEQVLPAAADVVSLLNDLPDATFLVTSRARLRVRGEHVFDVDPLGLPSDPAEASADEIIEAPAIRLFLDRARAADPRFDVTSDNAHDIARICLALEGVPLAIELAAARIRALTPAAMLSKLDRLLPLLVTGARDLPERQRTIEATVLWSVDLLGPEARALFVRLGTFVGDFSLDAVESVTAGAPWADDLLGTLLELVDGSLVRQHDHAAVPLFSMLVPVREIATSRFEQDADAAAVRHAHALFYVGLAHSIEPLFVGSTQLIALTRLEAERANIRAAYRHLIALGEVDAVADAVWRLTLYWWIRAALVEAKAWMLEILNAGVPLTDRTRAIAFTFSAWVSVWQPRSLVDLSPLEESVALFRRDGDAFSEGAALTVLSLVLTSALPPDLDRAEESQRRALELVTPEDNATFHALFRCSLASIELYRGHAAAALEVFEAVLSDATRTGDGLVESIALNNVGWASLALGRARPELFMRHLENTLRGGNDYGLGDAFEGLAACAAIGGDVDRAGILLGAAENARTRTGLIEQRSSLTYEPFVALMLASDRAAEFEAGRAKGRSMSRRHALELARTPDAPETAQADDLAGG